MTEPSSNMSRDEFIALLVSELQSQKESQGNSKDFFTGPPLSPLQSFKKLCYDYPLINNYDFRAFVEEVKLLRENPGKVTEPMFFHCFCLNEQFLNNFEYFVFQEETKEDTSNHFIESSRKEIVALLLAEVFLEYPNYVLSLPKAQLSNLLHPTPARIFALETDFMGKIVSNRAIANEDETHYSWEQLLVLFREYLMKGTTSLLTTGLNHPTIRQKLSLQSIIYFIKKLKAIINPQKESETKISRDIEDSSTLHQYLNRFSISNYDTTNDRQTSLYLTIKEILNHYISIINDILCHFPELFPTYFPLLAEVLLDTNSTDSLISGLSLNSTKDYFIEATIFGNHHLLVILKNISTFISNEEHYQQLQSTSSHTTDNNVNSSKANPAPDSHATQVSLDTNNPNAIKPRETTNPQLLKSMKEAIRKFFVSSNNLTTLITFIETMYQRNASSDITSMNKKKVISGQDIDVWSYYIEIGEVMFGGARIVSSISKTVYQQVISSRLLSHLLSIYYQILEVHLMAQKKLIKVNEGDKEDYSDLVNSLQEHSSQLWDYSFRLTKLLTAGILRDEGFFLFITSSPDTMFLWNQVLFTLKAPEGENAHLQYPKWIFWNVHVGFAFAYVNYLRSSPSSTLVSFWHSFVTTSIDTVNRDLQAIQQSEVIDKLLPLTEETELDEVKEGEVEAEDRKVADIKEALEKKEKEDRTRVKQYISKYFEGLQILCLIMNQEEFVLIRSIKGRQDPSIEPFFLMMKKFMVSVTNQLRGFRNLLQSKKAGDWVFDSIDRTIKATKTMQSSLEGNSSNKTD